MASDDREGFLTLGDDYELTRWRTDERDEQGRYIWHEGLPDNKDWDKIRMVTIDYDPEGEGKWRNIPISPDRPLDPYGSNEPGYRGPHKGGRYGPEYYYDLDDLATNMNWSVFSP